MADTFERLGIQLELEPLKGDPTQALATLKKTLSEIADVMKGLNLDKLGNIKMDGLSSELNKAKGSAKGVKDGLEQTAEAVAKVGERAKLAAQELQKVGSTWREFLTANKEVALAKVGGDWEQAQKLMSNFYRQWKSEAKSSSQQVEDDNKKVKSSLAETMKFEEDKNKQRAYIIRQQQQDEDKRHSLAIRNAEQEKAQWEKFRQFVERETQSAGRTQAIAFGMNEKATLSYNSYANRDADGAYKAYLKNLEDVKNQEIKLMTEKGQQILAILRNTEKAQKSELDKASKNWSDYLNALNKQGLKYFNGDVIPKSYVTNIGAAQAQALKYNESLSLPNANQFKEALASLAPLKASLTDVKNAIKLSGDEIRSLPADKLQQLKSALAPFKVTINETTGELKNMKKAIDWLPESFQKMGARLAEFYSLRSVLFAVSGQFRDAISGAIEFNQNIHDIAAISGSNKKEMDAIGESILNIAKNSRFSANEVAGLMQILAQAGIKARDLGQVSDVVGMFATATASKPDIAADVFTTSLTVFNKTADDSISIANALTAALNNSKLTTEGLATAFNYLAPQAAQFGWSLEQTLGVVAGMSQAGVKSSTIGTGVSQLLKELAIPKDRLKNLLDYYKIGIDEVNPKLHTFAEIVETLNSKNVAAEHLFAALESRVGRSIVTAVTLGADTFTDMTNSITGTNSALVAFDKTMEGPKARINVLKQEVLSLAVDLGNVLSPALSLVTSVITNLVMGLSSVPGVIIGASTALGVLLYAIKSLTIAALANPVMAGVTIGIAAVAAALALLGRETDASVLKAKDQIKAYTELSETTQKVKDTTSKAITESERENKALKEYNNLIKGSSEDRKKAEVLALTDIKLKADTKKSLLELQDAYPELLKKYDMERLKLGDLYKILKDVNAERAKGTADSIAEYNRLTLQTNELKQEYNKDLAANNNRAKPNNFSFMGNVENWWDISWYNPNALYRRDADIKKKEKTRQDLLKATDATELGKYKRLPDQTFVLKTPEELEAERQVQEKLNEKNPVATIPSTRGNKAEESYLAYADGKLNKMDAETAKQLRQASEEILRDTNATYENRMQAYELISDLINEEAIAASKAAADEEGKKFAASHKGVKYDAENNTLIGANVNSTDYKKYQTLLQARNKEIAAVAKKEQDKVNKELKDITKKASDDYNNEIQKINEDAAKREAEADKKILEQKFKSKFVTAEESVQAYFDYLASVYEKISTEYDAKIKEFETKFKAAHPSILTEQQKQEYRAEIAKLNAAEADAKNKAKVETNSMVSSAASSNIAKAEKQIGYDLGNTQAKISLQKEGAWTGDQINKLEAQNQQAVLDSYIEKQKVYALESDRLNLLIDEKTKKDGILSVDQAQLAEAADLKQKLTEINNLIDQQKIKVKEVSDESFMGNFTQGLRSGTQALGSFKSATQDLGKSVVSTMTDGITNSLFGMVKALETGKNAWKSFKDVIGNMLTSIGDMLTQYILKLMVVYAVQQLVGIFTSSKVPGANAGDLLPKYTPSAPTYVAATGGLISTAGVQHFATGGLALTGGFIPKDIGIAGKDSVPAMLMPGEYVIKKDMVDLYGVDYLKSLNRGEIQRFADGGPVGGRSTPNSNDSTGQGDSTAGTPYSFSIINVADVNSIPPIDGQAVVNIVSFDAAKKGPVYHTIKGVMQGR